MTINKSILYFLFSFLFRKVFFVLVSLLASAKGASNAILSDDAMALYLDLQSDQSVSKKVET